MLANNLGKLSETIVHPKALFVFQFGCLHLVTHLYQFSGKRVVILLNIARIKAFPFNIKIFGGYSLYKLGCFFKIIDRMADSILKAKGALLLVPRIKQVLAIISF